MNARRCRRKGRPCAGREHVHDIAEEETNVEEGEHQRAMAPEPYSLIFPWEENVARRE
jgi:hypothetical protein